jgi:CheY-like chemotaxis protein
MASKEDPAPGMQQPPVPRQTGISASIVLALVVVALVLNSALAIFNVRRVMTTQGWVAHTYEVLESLRDFLVLCGHQVEVAYNGCDGIGGSRTFKPEVVICDIGLPGMDGCAVATALRADANLRSARLIALSGYARPEDLQRSAAAGFDAHIAKPASVQAIEEVLFPLGKDGNRDV